MALDTSALACSSVCGGGSSGGSLRDSKRGETLYGQTQFGCAGEVEDCFVCYYHP